MARWFEFSDQAWLPGPIRRCFTELLQFQATTYRNFDAAIPKLNQALRRSRSREILDLCSGSGGPLIDLVPYLHAERFTLSDRFPPARSAGTGAVAPNVAWLDEPLDARAVPPRNAACRTLFASFHHFGAADARRILASAVEARAPIAIFEYTERRFERIWRLLFAPWRVACDTWRMRPRNLARLFWTFVVPVVPLVYTWDALVSHLRTYTPKELRALTAGLTGHAWEIGTIPPGEPLRRIVYLVGVPARTPRN